MTTPSEKECCEKCRCEMEQEKHRMCHDEKCPCHTAKKECCDACIGNHLAALPQQMACRNPDCDCHHSPDAMKGDWEEAFDNKMRHLIHKCHDGVHVTDIKDFIHSRFISKADLRETIAKYAMDNEGIDVEPGQIIRVAELLADLGLNEIS